MSLITGIDVSAIQGPNIDWQAVATSGVQFCIIRCGVGNSGKDSLYNQNVIGAKAAGLKVMAYNFIFPLPTIPSQPLRDPTARAKLHYGWTNGELACVDAEWPTPRDFSKWGCSSAQIIQWMTTYLQVYEGLSGQKPIIYTYPYWASSINFPANFSQYPLWIASYEPTPFIPKPWNDWVLWQNTGGGGHLPITGVAVDTDLAKDLSLWESNPISNIILTPDPPPAPVPVPQPLPVPPAPLPAPLPVPVAPTPDPNAIVVPAVIQQDFGWLGNLLNILFNLFKEDISKF